MVEQKREEKLLGEKFAQLNNKIFFQSTLYLSAFNFLPTSLAFVFNLISLPVLE